MSRPDSPRVRKVPRHRGVPRLGLKMQDVSQVRIEPSGRADVPDELRHQPRDVGLGEHEVRVMWVGGKPVLTDYLIGKNGKGETVNHRSDRV